MQNGVIGGVTQAAYPFAHEPRGTADWQANNGIRYPYGTYSTTPVHITREHA